MATLLKHQRTRCVQWCSDVYGLACVVYHADVDDSKCAFVCVCFRLVLFFLNFPPLELFFPFSDNVPFFFPKLCHSSSPADCHSSSSSSSSSHLNPRPLPKTPSVHWPENMVSYRDPSPLPDSPPPPLPVKKHHHRHRQVKCVCACVETRCTFYRIVFIDWCLF